ncbi:uncharacterized protein LOC116771955 isoform X2 [Danaus plexippus]|uniref:uncharacterized protein LOC116771955 isoform X2 n=1 Tax=Danaus plexippus TaxID=13037 RepID=UPI002AB033F0|nr:uncharacterized protein LOC116771955 isoform X2 [Danaus plexippus]
MEVPDLQSRNLCTTEDAFEKFQAVTMYEEDEFITLSDIISPPHANPDHDVSEILNGVQIDEVPMSIQDDKTENNSKIPLASNQATDVAFETNNQQDTIKISVPKTRGRKKKVPVENSNIQPILSPTEFNKTKTKRISRKQQSEKESTLTEDIISDKLYIEHNSDKIKETKHISEKVPGNSAKRKSHHSLAEKEETKPYKKMYKKGKRGRKPKHNKQEETLNEEKNNPESNITTESKNIGTKISLIAMKNKQKKGRKQYRLNNQNLVTQDTNPPQCEDKLSKKESDLSDSVTSNIALECGITKNSVDSGNSTGDTIIDMQNKHTDKNDITEEDMEEIPLSNLSRNSENDSNKNVHEKTMPQPKNSIPDTVTPVKKRGRPRKILNRSPTKMLLEETKITDDENTKCNKKNVSLQQKQNSYGSSKVNCEIENNLPPNSDFDITEMYNGDIVNIVTELSGPKLSSMKQHLSDPLDKDIRKDTPEESSIGEPNETNEKVPEDSSRRPVRRRVLKTWNYDEGSDEDPYANMESSDDEPRGRRKKGGRYNSDDEYFPGDKRQLTETESDNAMDEDELDLGESRKQKKKKNKKLDTVSNKSPRKRGRKSDAESTCPTERTNTNTDSRDIDFENCSDGLIVQGNGDLRATTKPRRKNKSQGETSEFENFIAKIVQGTDIKISKKSIDDVKTPLQIPTLDANDVHKSVDKCSQTKIVKTKSESAQTDTLYEIPMKEQAPLTAEQSEKACEFLSSIVQTTAELGQLMTQKSNDFINKKINTRHVTDTFKMDYCVKKSFLLFKLAKHNLVQMEEDLSKQYEEFLKENNLIQHREKPKIITSTSKASDSDCEIVEEPIATKAPVKAVFNPKTVFLNKELSIKIAKKPCEEPQPKKKLNIKGRNSVWINDSVVVKKIKTSQSFLAQDSRNKKPPDCKITLEMVNNFFKNYERQKALLLCAPYVRTEWFGREKKYICNYFVDSTVDFPEKAVIIQNENIPSEIGLMEANESNHLTANSKYLAKHTYFCPETLTSLCTKVLQNCLHSKRIYYCKSIDCRQKDLNRQENARGNAKNLNFHNFEGIVIVNDINRNILYLKNSCFESAFVQPLKTLCFKRVVKLMSKDNWNGDQTKLSLAACESEKPFHIVKKPQIEEQLKPLPSLCFKKVEEMQKSFISRKRYYKPESLKAITLAAVQGLLNKNSKTIDQHLVKSLCHKSEYLVLERNCYKVKTLIQMCKEVLDGNMLYSGYNIKPGNESSKLIIDINIKETKHQVKSLFQLCKEKLNIVLDKSTHKAKRALKSEECENLKLKKNSSKVKTLSQLSIQSLNCLLNKHFEVKTCLKLCQEKKYCDMTKTMNNSRRQNKKMTLENNCCELKRIAVKTSYESFKENLDIHIEEKNYVSKRQFSTSKKSVDDKLETTCNLKKSSPSFFNESSNNPLEKDGETENDEGTRINIVKSLKSLCNDKILGFSAEWLEDNSKQCETNLNITINNVNTVSEDVFSMAPYEGELGDHNYPVEGGQCPGVGGEVNYEDIEDLNNWESQVKMELRSCLDSTSYNEREDQDQNLLSVRIKVEPLDDVSENIADSTNIKTEPTCDPECIDGSDNFSNSNITPKLESLVKTEVTNEPTYHKSISYDENLFEAFVSSNKMIVNLNRYGSTSSEIFSQSSQRIRRQHEPDSDGGIDALTDSLNLLVPQNIDKSKVRLLESGTEEKEEYKKHDRKKHEKRKCKLKKSSKDLQCKTKTPFKDDVAVMTKQLRYKIRQGQNRNESSDSESVDFDFKTDKEESKENKRREEKEIQCNDVDSTEFINEKKCSETQYEDPYEENGQNFIDTRSLSTLSDSNQPSKILEDESFGSPSPESVTKNIIQKDTTSSSEISYMERHGWKCYSINSRDEKIYEQTYVVLDKLPESFVKTYFQYQHLTDQDGRAEDLDFDRLNNLKTLQRVRNIGNNENVDSPPTTDVTRTKVNSKLIEVSNVSRDIEPIESTMKHGTCNEVVPSEEESETLREQSLSVPTQSSENYFAKNVLMDDGSDSDSEKPREAKDVKEKLKREEQTYKTRSGRIIKCKIDTDESWKTDALMLTADKVMNKELALLHAPVTLKDEDAEEDCKDFKYKSSYKSQNTSKGQLNRRRIESDDDSSSEEQKQWFTTKEKLLKRLSKKNDGTDIDDAKRAKIVNEFIEKRGMPETRPRVRNKRRSNKNKVNERRKQLKVLSRELFGVDSGYTKKYSQANTSKGRRNIRKVKDKKSLARSTVVANMAEFERKRRLTIRQAQLREVLGCEEDVRVVVINDELCLEYDFQEKRPAVSVHPFFTKVMKAHQYEGVKLMWDACFETVAMTSAGGEGGGCILAHCMGLGKTLQVLALLHTVLTHPQLGMRRVLVCCPLSTVLNWVDEIHKWIGPVTNEIKQRNVKRKLQVFELSKLKKTYERAYQLEDWYNGGGIFIIGYELFRSLSTLDPVLDGVRPKVLNKIRTALLDPGPDIIVCDEGHLLKNDCSILAVAMSRVVTKRRIVLTGTPMQNNLREYYCMVNFVKPNLLGSYSEYSNRFENPIMNGQHRDSREEDIKLMKARTHILHKVLEGCLQRQEASVLYPYLPKKYEYTVFISLTKCQWELYKHYLTHYAKDTKQSVLRDFHVLQKVWTHPQVLHNFLTKTRADEKEPKVKVEKIEKLDDDLEESPEHVAAAAEWWASTQHRHELNELDSSNKFLVVFRLLHECVQLGDKVLIFSTSLYTMDALEFFLRRDNKWALGRDYYRLDGSVPPEVRQKWCREFNAPHNTHTKLFLISTRAGSLGLNMTAANRVIIMDTSWNPAHDIQSIFRVYRFGQKKDCYIYRLVAMGTMEQKIYERSVTKQAVACRVVDEQQIERHYNMAELSELYRLDEDGSGVCAGLAAGVRDPALLRVAALGGESLHAVHEHDSLLRGSSESVLPEHERNAAWMQFQQEHGTTHIQSVEINLPKRNDEDLANQSIEEEANDKDGESKPAHSESNKKTRNKKTRCTKQEPRPSTSQQDLDPELEEAMIKKIMNILIQHDFHTMKTLREISELVKNVRDVVANVPKDGLQNVDPLIASIARVLMEADNRSLQDNERNDHTDDTGEKSSDDMTLIERKRRKKRRDSDEEYMPDTRRRRTYTRIRKHNDPYTAKTTDDSAGHEATDTTSNTDQDIALLDSYINDNSKATDISHKLSESFTEETNEDKDFIQVDDNEEISERSEINTRVVEENEIRDEVNEIDDNDSSDECIEVIDDCDNSDGGTEDTSEATTENKPVASEESTVKNPLKSQERNTSKVTLAKEIARANQEIIISSEKEIIMELGLKKINTERLINNQTKDKNLLEKLLKNKDTIKKPTSNKESLTSVELRTSEEQKKTTTTSKQLIKLDRDSVISNRGAIPSESIVLSDDDEPVITGPGPQKQPRGDPHVTRSSEGKAAQDDGQPIPLHESVLTNKNFIKLVARTYLTGNPMLDEDAATLAAQYSSLKALKEVQASGNGLTSGPIYDIALQVLGKNLMKRLHNANPKINSADKILLNTAQLQDNLKCKDDKGQKTGLDENKALSKRKTVERTNASESIGVVEKAASTKQLETCANVVPVGIFKGPAAVTNQIQSVEECILPDEDEVILSSSPISSPKRFDRRNYKQLIVTAVSSEVTRVQEMTSTSSVDSRTYQTQSHKVRTTVPSTKSIIEADQSRNDSRAKKNAEKARIKTGAEQNNKKVAPSQVSSETISLDSDEDDLDKTQDNMLSTCSDPRTSIIRPADKKRASRESNSNNILLLPLSSNKTPSPSTATASICSENTVKASSQSKVDNNAPPVVKTTKCQPGDIIRINESGKVEILKRIQQVVLPSGVKNKILTSNSAGNNDNGTKAPLISTPSSIKPQTSVDPKQSVFKEAIWKIKPSGGRRDESDPLSVIRNAVFIPAVNNEKNIEPSEKISRHTTSSAPREATANQTKIPLKTKCNDNQTASKKPLAAGIELTNKSKTSSELKYTQVPKVTGMDANKDVIDLTDANSQRDENIQTNTEINEVDVAGPSRDTVSNKIATIKKLNKAPPKLATVTSKPIQSPSGSKRSSAWAEGASKKLKSGSGKQMTLSEFNLDDLDDIIELE